MSGIRELILRANPAGWWRDLGVVILLLLVAAFVFHTDLMDGSIYYEPDTGTYYYPVMATVDRAINRSSIPLWTPHIFGGYPLFADGEGGTLYPPNLLLLWLLPIQQAFVLLRVARFFLAGVFLYAFARTLGIGRYGSLIGALIFAYGSFMIGQLQHANLSNGAIWLPLVLLFVEIALRSSGRKRFLHLLLAGAAVAMQSLAVHIQPLILTLLALSLYVAFRTVVWRAMDGWRTAGRSSWMRSLVAASKSAWSGIPLAVLAIALIALVGFGLAAIQLIPLYELGQSSTRGVGPSYWFATLYSLPIHNLVTLIFPYFFAGPDGYGWSLWVPHESTVYAGVVPLALAIAALLFVRRRMVLFFGFLSALSLYLSFGDYPPVKLYWLLWQLPGFHFLRAPGRFTFLFVFCVAILAAAGLDWLVRAHAVESKRLWRSISTRVTLYGVVVAVLLGAIILGQIYLRDILLDSKGSSLEFIRSSYMTLRNWNGGLNAEGIYKSLLYTLDVSNGRTSRALILLLGAAIFLLSWSRFRRLPALWATLVLAVVLIDLIVFAVEFHPRSPMTALTTPSGVTKFLVDNNGTHRVYNRGYVRSTEPNRLMAWGVSIVGGYSSLTPARSFDFNRAIERGNLRLLDLWNVRYIVASGGQTMPPDYASVYQQDDVVIYENPHVLPRAFLVDSAISVPNGQTALNKVVDGEFDPARTAVLEERFDLSLLAQSESARQKLTAAGSESVMPRREEARIVEYGRESVRISAASPGNAFLVLSDLYYPGWKAYVDGREAKVYRADYLFRGVFLPAGAHEVVFSFEPASFYIGRAISVVTLFLVVIAILYCAVPRPLKLSRLSSIIAAVRPAAPIRDEV